MDDMSIRPGDVVYRYKFGVRHWGVCVLEGMILHNSPEKGEHTGTLAEFSDGKRIHVLRPQDRYRHEIILRAQSVIESPSQYRYLWRNCEHTITEILTGKASSQTVKFLGMFAMIGGTIYLASRIKQG